MKHRIQVALPVYLDGVFDYFVEGNLPEIGVRVEVKFQSRSLIGVVWSHKSNADVSENKIKSVLDVLDEEPVLSKSNQLFCENISSYYEHSLGEVVQLALPVNLRKKTAAKLEKEKVYFLVQNKEEIKTNPSAKQQTKIFDFLDKNKKIKTSDLNTNNISASSLKTLVNRKIIAFTEELKIPGLLQGKQQEAAKTLNVEQQRALHSILKQSNTFICWLLHGITGSGKTEVYLQLMSQIIASGQQVLMLVPEIGLAPQTIKRLQQRLAAKMVVLHSAMTDRERTQAWLAAKKGLVDVVIGTRSAIFTPLTRLGLIVVDEEHDLSYKQQDKLRYHARDIAVLKAKQLQVPIVLGSATPSLESLYNVQQQRYRLLSLSSRAGNARPPAWELIDLRKVPQQAGLSQPLIERMRLHLNRGEQVMLFLNRRGFSPALMCYHCGWLADCKRCDARYTLHQQLGKLICHHCDSQRTLPLICPACQQADLHPLGIGTERLEQHVTEQFSETAVIRIDKDSTRKKGVLEQKLRAIHTAEPAILIGTQMLAKGHHFPNVTLVAVVDADGMLFSSDFRAMEKGTQLLIQVGGRSGRGEKPGTVLLQTCHPEHPQIQLLLKSGYQGFAENELSTRKQLALPPYQYMALFRAEATQHDQVKQMMETLVQQFKNQLQNVAVSGPIPAVMFKRQGRYRYQILIQSDRRSSLHQLIKRLREQLNTKKGRKLARNVRWSLDVDPQEMV